MDVLNLGCLPAGVLQYLYWGSPTLIKTIVHDHRVALVCSTGGWGIAVQQAAVG
jgi:acyl-CoA reductase-like NAD-dependent aldehyde dehydrogenase